MTEPEGSLRPIATWAVPLVNGSDLQLEARPGEVITVVGANGSGKSALATWLAVNTRGVALRRVLAQRKLWLAHSGAGITQADRESYSGPMSEWDTSLESRYTDNADARRADIVLFDLLGKINTEHQQISDLLYDDALSREEVVASVGPRLFTVLNDVLARAGLHVAVGTTDRQSLVATHRGLGVSYPISHMSDGERNALLLAAEVLTAPENAVIVIDEPERHLHRSISARLIQAILEVRPDCGFIAVTHDLDLAMTLSSHPGRVFTALGVEWDANHPLRWDLHEVATNAPVTEAARRAILGGRKRVLFIEGTDSSIDSPLYAALFPDWSVVPSGSCESVIRSVTGLLQSTDHHWIEAAGIVDNDGRSEEESSALRAKGVHVLPVSEIECLYYLPEVLTAVAKKQSDVHGEDATEMVRLAKTRALGALAKRETLQRLAHKLAKDQIVRSISSHVPSAVNEEDVVITVPSPYAVILKKLQHLHSAANYAELVRSIPVRDTGFRHEVARSLLFQSYHRYQKVALLGISQSAELRGLLRTAVADLARAGRDEKDADTASLSATNA